MALSAVHLFAALFAVSFAGAMAVVFERKLAGMLVSIMVLGTLVSLAFLGFYYPEMRTVSYLNPFFIGVVLIGSIGRYNVTNVAAPIIVLIGFNIVIAVIGRSRATAPRKEINHFDQPIYRAKRAQGTAEPLCNIIIQGRAAR